MNEKRFIQLINLQIDGEISSEQLAELESEVARNARRRQVYHGYRRLQEASQVVYSKLGDALAETVDLKKYQILGQDSNRRLRQGFLYSAGALAAACLTVTAALSFFPDGQWGTSVAAHASETNIVSVEIFDPSTRGGRAEEASFVVVDPSEPFLFAGRSEPIPAPRKAEFLESASAPFPASFQATGRSALWEEAFPIRSPRVIRGDSSFEVSPDLATFQFRR